MQLRENYLPPTAQAAGRAEESSAHHGGGTDSRAAHDSPGAGHFGSSAGI